MQRSEHVIQAVPPAAARALQDLCRALDSSTRATSSLAEAMAARRTGWMSIRGSQTAKGPAELQGLADRCTAVDREVRDARQRLAQALGIPPESGVQRITRRLPQGPAHHLRQAAEPARRAAHRLQVETRLGQRLLDFANRAWMGLCRDVARAAQPDHHAYDQNARMQQSNARTGTLLDGRM